MAEVEDLLKAWLRNEGLLFEGLHENRKARDTELTVVVTQADYTRVVERTLLLIKQVDDRKRRLLGVGECAREEEARAEQERAKAQQEVERRGQEVEKSKQMAEKTAHLAFETRMAELELVKLGLTPGPCIVAFITLMRLAHRHKFCKQLNDQKRRLLGSGKYVRRRRRRVRRVSEHKKMAERPPRPCAD